MGEVAKMPAPESRVDLEKDYQNFAKFLILTYENDSRKVDELRVLIRDNPDLITTESRLADDVRDSLIEKAAQYKGRAVILEAEMVEMAKALASSEAPPLAERLMIEAVLLSWLHVQYYERFAADSMGGRMDVSAFAEKMLTLAHNRYGKAMTALLRVQALMALKTRTEEKPAGGMRLLK